MSGESTQWRVIKSRRSEFLTVQEIERMVMGKREKGFFKFTNRKNQKHIGPLLADELISNRLAKNIGLPVAKTELMTINRRTGIVSIAKRRKQLWRWNQVAKHGDENVVNSIVNPKRLYKTFVFDIWICNIDRSGKNIILYRTGDKYDFYLIDHELALLGAVRYENKPWDSTFWDRVVGYSHGYNPALLPHMKNYAQLAPYVRRIQRIRPQTIRAAVNSVPPYLLSKYEKSLVEKILFRRQRRLHDIVSRCISDSTRN